MKMGQLRALTFLSGREWPESRLSWEKDEQCWVFLEGTHLCIFKGLWAYKLAQVWEVSKGPQLYMI